MIRRLFRRLFRRRDTLPQLPHPLNAVLDELAGAFAAAPGPATALLLGHADAAFRLDALVIDPYAAAHEIAMAAAEVDGTRRALLGLSPAARHMTRTTLETDR